MSVSDSYRKHPILGPERFASVGSAPPPPPAQPPRGFWGRYLARVVTGIPSLLTGMAITLRHLLDRHAVVTREYPENREQLRMPARFRGRVTMPHDADGEHRCTACTLCEKACPNGSISVLSTKNIAGRKVLGRYIYRFDQCTLCSLCVEACPHDAIVMSGEFETATLSKAALVMVLNHKEGR